MPTNDHNLLAYIFPCIGTSKQDSDPKPALPQRPPSSSSTLAQQSRLPGASCNVPSGQQEHTNLKPNTGRRRAGSTTAGLIRIPLKHDDEPGHQFTPTQPKPSDYLYFGDGSSPRSSTVPSRSSTQRHPGGTPQHVANPAGNTSAGNDNSGYLATGLNNNSGMAYQNLTYGGSLQYDYAGTQTYGAPHNPATSSVMAPMATSDPNGGFMGGL